MRRSINLEVLKTANPKLYPDFIKKCQAANMHRNGRPAPKGNRFAAGHK